MSDYKYIDPPKDEKVTWLRAINDAWHNGKKESYCEKIPKDSITWVTEKDIYEKEDNGEISCFLCENNRHSSNYPQEDFEIISGPNDKKEELLITIL